MSGYFSVVWLFFDELFLEHLNIVLFELARQYHGILNKVDISTSLSDVISSGEIVITYSYL